MLGALLLYSTLAVAVVTVLLPYSPFADALGFVPLSWPSLLVMFAITAADIAASEIAKHILHHQGSPLRVDQARSPDLGASAIDGDQGRSAPKQ